jgi:hypothetical protein
MSDFARLSAESWYEQDSFDFYKFTYGRGQFDVPFRHFTTKENNTCHLNHQLAADWKHELAEIRPEGVAQGG